jgi:hypothetical protein
MALALAVVTVLTIALLAGGLLDTAAQVAAYATAVLAVGTIGLAVGAIGTYLEQRETNRQQAAQLAAASVADIAKVMVDRRSGPGEFLAVAVRNDSSRAIREVYVWAECRGMTGRYHAAVQALGGGVGRGMRNVPHGSDLYWQYRAIRPGEQALFDQLRNMPDQTLAALTDTDITVYAEFIDANGDWWRIDEDGNVTQVHPGSPPPPQPRPINPAIMLGIPHRTTGRT